MMEETEIKRESDKLRLFCHVCLSIGRKLMPLGNFIDVYRKLMAGLSYQDTLRPEEMQLCWECYALLGKAAKFASQVQRAHEVLRLGENYIYGRLSSLTTVIINDSYPNTILINDQNERDFIKEEPFDETDLTIETDLHYESNENDDKKDCTDLDTKSDLEDNKLLLEESEDIPDFKVQSENISKTTKKPQKSSKWKEKRQQQNRKPKFKIVLLENSINLIRKAKIGVTELLTRLDSEKNNKRFEFKKYKCVSCVKCFRNEILLLKHNQNYHNKDKSLHICDICSSGFEDKGKLRSHIQSHFNKYICDICRFSSHRRKQIDKHVNEKHKKWFQCLSCEVKCSSRREFFKHYKQWHEKFICDYCGVSFKMKYCIKEHLRKQHTRLTCKHCPRTFARYNGLWLHTKLHHNIGTGAYCVECDRRYPDVYRYRHHLATSAKHTRPKKRTIVCPDCGKKFTKNIYMKDHYNLVHLKLVKYRCEECDKNFVRNADLVKHTRRVHQGILPPRNKICYVCGKGFSTNRILANHIRTHTGERPYSCSSCSARFTQSVALAKHVRAVHHTVPG